MKHQKYIAIDIDDTKETPMGKYALIDIDDLTETPEEYYNKKVNDYFNQLKNKTITRNKEKEKERKKIQYNKNKQNPEWIKKHNEKTKEWYHKHPEMATMRKEAQKKWYSHNKQIVQHNRKRWRKNNPEAFKKSVQKTKSRRRQLGFVPLNSWFPQSDAHHINKEVVIYIPRKTHQQYRHAHKRPNSMDVINKNAFFYLMSEMIS